MTKVLISGADGFIASHLIDFLIANEDVEVFGTVRRLADKSNLKDSMDQIELLDMELTDSLSVDGIIKKVHPDKIFHLAAQSFVPTSWTAPANTINSNVIGTLNILDSVRNHVPDAFVQIAGTSEEYGMVRIEECPIKETNPLRPLSPYGVSKVAADLLGYQYAKSYNLNILRTRTFNQTGPRRGEAFVDANFARQIVNIEQGSSKKLKHGNLEAVRDFTDVRDSVRAYWELSNKKWNGDVVNVCTGKGKSMRAVLDTLIGCSNSEIITEEDPSRMRPSDVPLLIGDNSILRMYTDWEPYYTWEDSIRDLLEYTRGKL